MFSDCLIAYCVIGVGIVCYYFAMVDLYVEVLHMKNNQISNAEGFTELARESPP